jgi:drug/metabolite transporter (DMT)-like permease
MMILLAPWALLLVAAVWGLSFVWMKDILDQQDVYSFLFCRFLVASAIMFIARPTLFTKFNVKLAARGGLAGLALGTGYIFQTLGLERTTPAITGFVTGLYVVFTPLIALIFFHDRITWLAWFYIGVATVGLGVLSISGWKIGLGEFFVLVSAILFAIHIIFLSRWSKDFDTYLLTFAQLFTCSLVAGVPAFISGFTPPPDQQTWSVVLFTAIFATFLAFIVQTWSQARISAVKVAVILTMEVVFAALFSVALGAEPLTLRMLVGGSLILIAMVMIVQPRVSPPKDGILQA